MSASRRAILILGMHRSGTSALTRVLNLRGAALPAAVLPANAANVAGYWEPAVIVSLHDRLLAEAGSAWDDPTAFPDEWFDSPRGRAYVDELVLTLGAEYGDASLLVVKDPRACRLVGLWERAFRAAGITPGVVLAVRHPLEVAASLARRDGMPETHGLWLWLEHVRAAEAGTRSMPRVTVTYEQVLADGPGCSDRIASALSLDLAPRTPEGDSAIAAFLEPQLRHAVLGPDALTGRDVPPWIPRVYAIFQAASRGEPIDTAMLDAVGDEVRGASAPFATSVRWLAHRAWAAANLAAAAEEGQRLAAAERERTVQALDARIGRIQAALAAEQAVVAEARQRTDEALREADRARQAADEYRRRVEALEGTWAVRLQRTLSGR